MQEEPLEPRNFFFIPSVLLPCLVTFSVAMIRYLDKSQLKEIEFIWALSFQSIVVAKSW